MDKRGIELIIFAMVLMVSFVIVLTAITIERTPESTEEVVEEIECENEFVITSRYVWILNKYKTYSKCIKCGKEI